MTKVQRKRQRILRKDLYKTLLMNLFICLIIMIVGLVTTTKVEPKQQVIDEPEQVEEVVIETQEDSKRYSKDWDAEESYLLAKIAMAEAEECDTYTKALVISTVLNRVHSKVFANTIEDVIFEERGGVHQFTPISNGRWNRVEPNEDCWKALELVITTPYDMSQGALYFESCKSENNWHSRNLEFICKSGSMRFYK